MERYGFREGTDWRIADLHTGTSATRWTVLHNGAHFADFEFALAGEYNVLNATAAAAMASHYGITAVQIQQALASFKSVKRRLEVKAEINGITIIDDFAHHPTAIEQTLKALRTRYPGRRLWAILEPRSNTLRRNVFQRDLVNSLSVADQIVLAGIFKSEAIPEHERLDVSAVTSALANSGKPAREFASADEIVAAIVPDFRCGDVIAILSNGGFGGIYQKLPERIRALTGAAAQ